MMKVLLAGLTCLAFSPSAYAHPQSATIVVAQASEVVPEGATGGRSGTPNQSQSIVPEGATGGRSGGPNQAQAVVKPHSKKHKKTHH